MMAEVIAPPVVRHPLNPLSATEINITVEIILSEKGFLKATTRFIFVSLKEPLKTVVYAFKKGNLFERETFVVILDSSTGLVYEAVVSLTSGTIVSWENIPGVQPTMTADEQVECEEVVKNDPAFQDALKRYGISNPDLVMVDIWTAGHYGAEEESSVRLARPLCFLRTDETDNGYAHPIEGLRPVVDLNAMKVLRVEEHEFTPIPPERCQAGSKRFYFICAIITWLFQKWWCLMVTRAQLNLEKMLSIQVNMGWGNVPTALH